jgi:hypothetical protein
MMRCITGEFKREGSALNPIRTTVLFCLHRSLSSSPRMLANGPHLQMKGYHSLLSSFGFPLVAVHRGRFSQLMTETQAGRRISNKARWPEVHGLPRPWGGQAFAVLALSIDPVCICFDLVATINRGEKNLTTDLPVIICSGIWVVHRTGSDVKITGENCGLTPNPSG